MKRIKIFSLVIAVLFVSTLFPLGVVNADGGNQKISPIVKPVPKVISTGANDTVYTYGGFVADKEATIKLLNSFAKPTNVVDTKGYSYSLSNTKSIMFGSGICYAQFSSNLDFDAPAGFTTRVTIVQGTSHVAWTGSDPQYNADDLTHTDTFTWNSITSASISTNGGGWAVSGHTATWHYTSHNTWYSNHIFGGLTGSGMLTSIVETTTGDFRFNSVNTSITPTAYKSMIV